MRENDRNSLLTYTKCRQIVPIYLRVRSYLVMRLQQHIIDISATESLRTIEMENLRYTYGKH
jgi:hypothetical protein